MLPPKMALSKILPFGCLVLGLVSILLLNLSVATADNTAVVSDQIGKVAVNDILNVVLNDSPSMGGKFHSVTEVKLPSSSQ